MKKLIMNIDDAFEAILLALEDKLGIKRGPVIRLAIKEKYDKMNQNG